MANGSEEGTTSAETEGGVTREKNREKISIYAMTIEVGIDATNPTDCERYRLGAAA